MRDAMRMGAALEPRLMVRRGTAGLLAAEGPALLVWALLWALFLSALPGV